MLEMPGEQKGGVNNTFSYIKKYCSQQSVSKLTPYRCSKSSSFLMSKEDFVDINKYGIKLIIYNFYIQFEKEW